ncbi:hypothetical protein CVT25_009580, partial [Psilocybe cyanescens]
MFIFEKGSINSRINILYFLDSLCETCLMVKSHSKSDSSRATNANGLYVELVTRDLNRIIDSIVPEGRQGLPNLVSTKQILENWRSKRYIDPQRIDDILENWRSKRYIDPQRIDDVFSFPTHAPISPHPTLRNHQNMPHLLSKAFPDFLDDIGIILRTHTRDGSVMQKHVHVTAAFGRLVAQKDLVAICVSSGKGPSKEILFDLTSLNSMVEKLGYPETIVCWDLRTDAIWEVPIPRLDESLILHSVNFSFVSSDRITFTGNVEQSFANVNAGFLECFSLQDPSQNDATIMRTSDMNAEIGMIRPSGLLSGKIE